MYEYRRYQYVAEDARVSWPVCASLTLFIVISTLAYGFEDRLYG